MGACMQSWFWCNENQSAQIKCNQLLLRAHAKLKAPAVYALDTTSRLIEKNWNIYTSSKHALFRHSWLTPEAHSLLSHLSDGLDWWWQCLDLNKVHERSDMQQNVSIIELTGCRGLVRCNHYSSTAVEFSRKATTVLLDLLYRSSLL